MSNRHYNKPMSKLLDVQFGILQKKIKAKKRTGGGRRPNTPTKDRNYTGR